MLLGLRSGAHLGPVGIAPRHSGVGGAGDPGNATSWCPDGRRRGGNGDGPRLEQTVRRRSRIDDATSGASPETATRRRNELNTNDAATIAWSLGLGSLAGWALGGGWFGLATGFIIGAVLGIIAARAGVRLGVAVSVVVGTVVGAFIGRNLVRVLCLPGSCPTLEIVAAVLGAIGAFVGVGLVVALVTRSFDEYHEAVEAGRPPPEPGCEQEES